VGKQTVEFTAKAAGSVVHFRMRWTFDLLTFHNSLPWYAEFDDFKLVELAAPLDTNPADMPLDGITLADYCEEILEHRAGATAADWVRTDAQAIDTENPYPFGIFISDQITTMAALRAPLDSFCAAITNDEYGKLRIVALHDPATLTPAVTLTYNHLDDAPLGDGDDARGLTLTAGGRYTWSTFSDADFVDDFSPATGIDAATRTRFKRQCQFLVKSHVALPDLYAFADNATEINTVLDIQADVQAQHDSVCALYTQPRVNYTLAFSYAFPQTALLRPGMAARVIVPRGDFAGGKNLLIKRVRHYPLACRYELTGWG
jgi:hypothetical protein